jgi:magnesium chelatase family protein
MPVRICERLPQECFCTPPQIQRYMSKISGPLMDRIDIQIDVPAVPYKELANSRAAEPSETTAGQKRSR